MSTTTTTIRRRLAAVAVATTVSAGLGACGAGDESTSDSGGEAASSVTQAPGEGGSDGAATKEGAADAVQAWGAVAPVEQKLARTASLQLAVTDIGRAAAKVRSTATAVDGVITSEDIRTDGEHGWGEIVVSVPSASLDRAVDDLAAIGTVEHRASTTTDLTSSFTDTASRIKTSRAAIARVRELIASTDDITQLVTLEGELSTREGDLEVLLGRLEGITHMTSMSPVTVSLSEPVTPPDGAREDARGFVAGLSAGWSAFVATLGAGLTVLGALTPFVLAGAVVLAPVALWLRRRRRLSPADAPAASGPAPRRG